MISSSSFQKIIVGIAVFLLFAPLAVSSFNNPISEKSAEMNYKLICTDPVNDVKNYTSKETVENNETVKRPNIDLKEIYMKHNETTLFVKINVIGEIESSPWVEYELRFEANGTMPIGESGFFMPRSVIVEYKNGTATFEGEENESIENYYVNSSLTLKIPIIYLQDEGCIQNNSLCIIGGSAYELGAEKIEDEWVMKYFYYDSLDQGMGCFYFFSLGGKIISIIPNPVVAGEPIKFTGVGGDPYENVTYEWWSSIDGFLSNETSFTTSNLSAGNHTIYFRVRNSTAMVEKTENVTVEEASPTIFTDNEGDVKTETDEIINRPNIDIANFSVIRGYSSLIITITVYGEIEDLNGTRYYVDFGEWIINGNKITRIAWYENGTAFYEENSDRYTITVYHNNKTITFEIQQTCKWGWDIGSTIRNVGAKDEYGYDECYYSYFFPSPNISINISITPNPAVEGETVYFTGSCNLSGNLNYEWKSNIDGVLSNKSSFSTGNLSVGNHTITFTVWKGEQEGYGWLFETGKYASTSTTLSVLPKTDEKNDMLLERIGTLISICVLIGILLVIKKKSGRKRKHKLFTV